jgi:hypothetical protein
MCVCNVLGHVLLAGCFIFIGHLYPSTASKSTCSTDGTYVALMEVPLDGTTPTHIKLMVLPLRTAVPYNGWVMSAARVCIVMGCIPV